jgi:hypothetical protein
MVALLREDGGQSVVRARWSVVAFTHRESFPIRLRPWPRGHERSVRTYPSDCIPYGVVIRKVSTTLVVAVVPLVRLVTVALP